MPRIGIVLGGGATKGAYEVGCLRAIEEYFGKNSIKCVSSASVGALVGQCYGEDKMDDFERIWKSLGNGKKGKASKMILSYSGNKSLLKEITDSLCDGTPLPFEHYVSIWNFTKSKVDYIPFHRLPPEYLEKYIRGAIAIPFFSRGEVIDGSRILDGAFLDNIPAYPLINKKLDYIFCIYFDNCRYFFENEEFDRRMIKLFDFPNEKMLETLTYKNEDFDKMVQYGYEYTKRVIEEIFSGSPEDILRNIDIYDNKQVSTYKPRLTTDIVLNNINIVTKRYSKRLTNRKKKRPVTE